MSASHQTIPTIKPSERALLVTVSESTFASNGGVIPVEDTLYGDAQFQTFFGRDYLKQFSGFKYKEQRDNGKEVVKGEGQGGVLLFVRTKTDEERNRAFRTQQITERVNWDAVTEWIQFGKETGFPLSQNTINGQGKQAIVTADRWLVPRGYRPGQSLMTIVTVKEYLSDVPWLDYQMQSDEPQPTEVMWDLVGSHGTTGRCLHPDVEVPAQATAGYRVVTTAGDTQSASSTAGKGWLFPKTNHKKRQDFTIIDVKYIDGQYYRREATYHVPIPMSKIVQQSRPL